MARLALPDPLGGWFNDAALAVVALGDRLRPPAACTVTLDEAGTAFTFAPTAPSGAKAGPAVRPVPERQPLSSLAQSLRLFSRGSGRPVVVTVELPASWVMTRSLTVDAEARPFLDRFVRSKLAGLSPVDPALLTIGLLPGAEDGGRLGVTVAMVQRARLAAVQAVLASAGCRRIAFAALHGTRPILLDAGVDAAPSPFAKTALMGAAGSGLLAFAVASIWFSLAQHSASARMAALKEQADVARAAITASAVPDKTPAGAAERVREARQSTVILSDALDRLAGALPSHSHLTELAFTGGVLRFSGFTASLPDVLTAVENEPLFSGTKSVGVSRVEETGGRADFAIETTPAPGGGAPAP
jgi:hypothetical protein